VVIKTSGKDSCSPGMPSGAAEQGSVKKAVTSKTVMQGSEKDSCTPKAPLVASDLGGAQEAATPKVKESSLRKKSCASITLPGAKDGTGAERAVKRDDIKDEKNKERAKSATAMDKKEKNAFCVPTGLAKNTGSHGDDQSMGGLKENKKQKNVVSENTRRSENEALIDDTTCRNSESLSFSLPPSCCEMDIFRAPPPAQPATTHDLTLFQQRGLKAVALDNEQNGIEAVVRNEVQGERKEELVNITLDEEKALPANLVGWGSVKGGSVGDTQHTMGIGKKNEGQKKKVGKKRKRGAGDGMDTMRWKNYKPPPVVLPPSFSIMDIFSIPAGQTSTTHDSLLLKPRGLESKEVTTLQQQAVEQVEKEKGEVAAVDECAAETGMGTAKYGEHYDVRRVGGVGALLRNASRYNTQPVAHAGAKPRSSGKHGFPNENSKALASDETTLLPIRHSKSLDAILPHCITWQDAKRARMEEDEEMLGSVDNASELTPDVASANVIRLTEVRIGTLVRPGPDWEYGDQDLDGVGEIIGITPDGWAEVQWPNRCRVFAYRIGQNGKYDLVIASIHGECENTTILPEVI